MYIVADSHIHGVELEDGGGGGGGGGGANCERKVTEMTVRVEKKKAREKGKMNSKR